MSLSDFISLIPKLNEAPSVIYYGGTFNPWHQGHDSCLQLATGKGPIIVIPDNNPQKNLSETRTSLEEIKQKLSQIDGDLFLFDEFFSLSEKTPTSHWIARLKTDFPQKKHNLLMGHDSFVGLDTWIDYKDLVSNLNAIYVVSRLDDKEQTLQKIKCYKAINPLLEIIELGNHPFEHLSSTKLRKR